LSISPTFYEHFLNTRVFFAASLCLQFLSKEKAAIKVLVKFAPTVKHKLKLEKGAKKLLYENAAFKLLVKLTPCCSSPPPPSPSPP